MSTSKPTKSTIQCPACKQAAGILFYDPGRGLTYVTTIPLKCPSPTCGHYWDQPLHGSLVSIQFGPDPSTFI
jgi:hypothetical protein